MHAADASLWHLEQFSDPKRSTIRLREFVTRIAGDAQPPEEVLDAGCGAGANMSHLAHLWPTARWTGLDHDPELLAIGRQRLEPERFTMVQGDFLALERLFGRKHFDVRFSIMTLSWIDDYERAVEQMFAVTRGWLFVLNLFSESELDAFIRMRGRMPGRQQGYDEHYNVYSLPRFERFCRERGARAVVAEPFEIDVDLPRTDPTGMGTFTELTGDGRRIQFSGPLLMPWWFVAVRI